MARLFEMYFSTSLGSLSAADTAVSGWPVTISAWINTNYDRQTLACALSGGGDTFGLKFESDSGMAAWLLIGGQLRQSISGLTLSYGTWNHGAAKFTSNTSRTGYANGVAGTPETTNKTSPTLTSTTIFSNLEGGTGLSELAEIGIWNTDLTDAEIDSLAKGACPLLIRPEALVRYWPLYGRHSPEIDLVGGVNLTLSGSAPVADHPRIIQPRRRVLVSVPVSAPPATTSHLSCLLGVGG